MTTEAERFWDERYGQSEQIWSGHPNGLLVEVAAELSPGSALDLGCGEGGDAIWLAARGWQVTAVDISRTALARASAAASAAGLAIRVEQHDFAQSFPEGSYDLVSAQFLQSPIEFPRAQVLQSAALAVAPGGLLLIVEHATVPPWSSHHHEQMPTAAETVASLELDPAQWAQDRVDTPEREVTNDAGETATVSDNLIVLRRH